MYNVLVAEDEPWVLRAIVEMVEKAVEFRVVGECINGEEAWQLIFEEWPTLLITDIMMPQMDGLHLIELIAKHHIPLVPIIISGYDNFQYAQKAMKFGVSEYLLKPIDFELLQQSLHRSKEKLETLRGLNEHVVKFQANLDLLQEGKPKLVQQKQTDLIESVLRLKNLNRNARVGLLNIFDSKLKMLLKDYAIDVRETAPLHSDNDSAILAYFKELTERWILQASTSISTNIASIENACIYIKKHYREDISLTEMTQYTHFSTSRFSALFKRHTGNTLIEYVNRLRIEEAKKQLVETAFSVSEIAEQTGFSAVSYFTRVFKASVGLSPLEYRKKMGS